MPSFKDLEPGAELMLESCSAIGLSGAFDPVPGILAARGQ
jgi:hypothetical protein